MIDGSIDCMNRKSVHFIWEASIICFLFLGGGNTNIGFGSLDSHVHALLLFYIALPGVLDFHEGGTLQWEYLCSLMVKPRTG